MKSLIKLIYFSLVIVTFLFLSACANPAETSQTILPTEIESADSIENEKPKIPDLQAEILNRKDAKTESSIGNFDFTNFTYPLPRGWQDADSNEITLENGIRRLDMTERRIGMEYVSTKFFDVNGDGEDEALVILRVLTGSISIPQNVYIFEWKDESPRLIFNFGTGDRADGGLKNIYSEDGELTIELFGRDRYIFGQMETSKIVGDEADLCCPTHWTKTIYKLEGNRLKLEGDRWTYSLQEADLPPIKNMNETRLEEERGS